MIIKEQKRALGYLVGRVSSQRKILYKKISCIGCSKEFTSITPKGLAFPLLCNKCSVSRTDEVTIYDREQKVGQIPSNLIKAYNLDSFRPSTTPKKSRPKSRTSKIRTNRKTSIHHG